MHQINLMNINTILKAELSRFLSSKYNIDFHNIEIQLTRKDFEGDVQMKTINLNQGNEEVFEFVLHNEPTTDADFGAPSS